MNPRLTQTIAEQRTSELRARAAEARRAGALPSASGPRLLTRALGALQPRRRRRLAAQSAAAAVVPCD